MTKDPQKKKASMASNPYLQTKAIWNDLYGDLHGRYRLAQWFNLGLLFGLLILVWALVSSHQATRIKPVPFIVHGHTLVTANTASTRELETLKPLLAKHLAEQFIYQARRVSLDSSVNAENQLSVFSQAEGATIPLLKNYYRDLSRDPLIQDATRQVHVQYVLQKGNQSMDVHWREDWLDAKGGQRLRSDYFLAQLTYRYQNPPQDELQLQHNPLGFYVIDLAWSPQLPDEDEEQGEPT